MNLLTRRILNLGLGRGLRVGGGGNLMKGKETNFRTWEGGNY